MKKEIGLVGLGRMGMKMSVNLVEHDYKVVGYNKGSDISVEASSQGILVANNLTEVVNSLESPRVIWLMVPSKVVDEVLDELVPLLSPGDTIIDGGNSFYKDSLRRHKALLAEQLNFLDCGTSGGMDGARSGASLMVGGERSVFETHEHIFNALAAKDGYALVGKAGAGHFVKMIHNGIEYGMMGAIAEGVAILHKQEQEFDIDIKAVFKPYEHESIITSKLVTWLRQAYDQGQIEDIAGVVPIGETEFEMEHIVNELGEAKVLEAALTQRKETRVQESYLGKLVAAMRNQFGGHSVVNKK